MKDGVFDQIGTAAELITNPATDYVREFTQDIPKAKVLTAADVMKPGAGGSRRVQADDLVETLIPRLLDDAEPLDIVDESGSLDRIRRPRRRVGTADGVTVTAVPIGTVADRRVDLRRWMPLAILGAGIVALQLAFRSTDTFPAKLDTFLSDPIDRAGAWMRTNRLDRTIDGRFDPGHPIFTKFFTPISKFIDGAIGNLTDLLLWAPWFVVIAAIALFPLSRRMWTEAAVVVASFAYMGLFDLWKTSMQTFSLMTVSVLLAVVIGLPLGVWAAMQPRVEMGLRPVLDAMQTIPAFVYFLPLFMLLGIGNTPAAVATVIYALPPVVRLTTLGIKQVPDAAVEASTMFGASRRQTMLKVQIPMAVRTIVTGMSQTVMMALGIVVLATLVGADRTRQPDPGEPQPAPPRARTGRRIRDRGDRSDPRSDLAVRSPRTTPPGGCHGLGRSVPSQRSSWRS